MKPACFSEIFLRCQRVNEIQHSVDVQRKGCPLWIYLVNLLIIPSCKILCTFKKLRNFTGSTGNFLCKSSFYRHWFSTRGCLPVPLKSPQFPTTKQSQLHGLKNIWSVSGSEHLFLEWTNFLNKAMVLPQFCVESFFGAKGGDSTVIIQINYTSLTISIFHQIGWSRIWLLHHQIPKKSRGTLRTFGKNLRCDFCRNPVCKWEAKLWSRPYEGS